MTESDNSIENNLSGEGNDTQATNVTVNVNFVMFPFMFFNPFFWMVK